VKSMKKILFLCTGNSCRSQMAEAILNRIGKGRFTSVSAGAKPAGYVHPFAIERLAILGYPTEGLRSKSLDEFKGQSFDVVITVCDRAKEACPVWPGAAMVHWGFEDPADALGTDDEKRKVFAKVFDQIQARIQVFVA